MRWGCVEHVLGMCWLCFGQVLGRVWACCGDGLGMFLACFRDVSGMCLACFGGCFKRVLVVFGCSLGSSSFSPLFLSPCQQPGFKFKARDMGDLPKYVVFYVESHCDLKNAP